jgi:hypothetical protein
VAAIEPAARAAVRARVRGALRPALRLASRMAGLLGGVLATGHAAAADLPEDRADVMYHSYTGGGVTANGPALLVRKSIDDSFSLSASYYVDAVSNASIDVVTTASPYHETRTERAAGLDYVYRDALISVAASNSKEPDYTANSASLDVAQDIFGGMTTVNLGYSRGWDTVGKRGYPAFADSANHWQYRAGVTQILTPRWLASANVEVVSDEGYLGSPYRAARVFGAAVPESDPRTRSSRALALRAVGSIGANSAVRASYRYFWDTWDIRAHTFEVGYSRYLQQQRWLLDGYLRYYKQSHASFYSNNFTSELTYMSRNRQLSTFDSVGLGVKGTYSALKVPARYEIKLNGALERLRFQYSDFTDIRTGKNYSFDATVLELYVSATF